MRQSQRHNQFLPPRSAASPQASEESPNGSILLAATELFSEKIRHSIEEKRIFLELARNLLPATPVEDRRKISNLLASHPEMPADFSEQLASDTDTLTAYPALRYSPSLSVDLLTGIAQAGPESSRRAIANRPSLGESTLRALCEHGESGTVRILLERDDIQLGKPLQALLGRRGEIVADLGLQMDERDALSPEGLMGQFLHLPAKLKANAIATAELTSLVKQAQSPNALTGRLQGGSSDRHDQSARLRLQEALVREALARNRSRFADLIGQGLGLPRSTCDLLLQEDQREGLTIALKVLGLSSRQTVSVLLRLVGETLKLEELRACQRLHRKISLGAAEVLVGQWMLQDTGSDRGAHAGNEERGAGRHQTGQYRETMRRRSAAGRSGAQAAPADDGNTADTADTVRTGTGPRPAA